MLSQITLMVILTAGTITVNPIKKSSSSLTSVEPYLIKLKEKKRKDEIQDFFSNFEWFNSIDLLGSNQEEVSTFLLNAEKNNNVEKDLDSNPLIDKYTKDQLIQLENPTMESEGYNITQMSSNDSWISSIQLDKAREIQDSALNVKVGLMDSGVTSLHQDLRDFLNKSLSKSFVDGFSALDDNGGHGTQVAGIITAKHNNNDAYGICNGVDLISLRTCNDSDESFISDIIEAINYAESIDCDIINFSYSFENEMFGDYLYESISNFSGLFVCSSGNDGNNLDITHEYPVCTDLDNIIAVGATNSSDKIQSGLNTSKKYIDLFAPGGGMPLLNNKGGVDFAFSSGYTSYAAPVVTGVAALYLETHPTISVSQLKNRILSMADKTSEFENKCVSGGRINAFKVLHEEHTYNYTWLNTKQHRNSCKDCDYTIISGHTVAPDAFEGGNKYANCLLCGGRAEMGFVVGPNSYSNNEQSKVINGILVLSNMDYERYLKGGLKDEEILSYFN